MGNTSDYHSDPGLLYLIGNSESGHYLDKLLDRC
jgi:hypothetical protein